LSTVIFHFEVNVIPCKAGQGWLMAYPVDRWKNDKLCDTKHACL